MDKKIILKNNIPIVILLYIILVGISSSSAQQNLLAVLDLTSNGTIPQKKRTLISDKINETIALDSTYMLFDRKMLPELLKQLTIDESATVCSDQQCLVLTGSLIGANIIIGGTVKYEKQCTNITLNMIDVVAKQMINSVSMSSGSKKTVFLENDIPALVKSLLNPGTPPPTSIVSDQKGSILKNPFLYAGTLLIGGAAVGAYYLKFYNTDEKETLIDEVVDLPLSMDDAPQRIRGPGE